MNDGHKTLLYTAVIRLNPKTKKNSQEIRQRRLRASDGQIKYIPFIAQNKKYEQYEKDAGWFLRRPVCGTIDFPVNVKCIFFRKDNQRVDLTNLLEAVDDILVKYKVLKDDNFHIIVGHDGSRVKIDKEHPRTEIYIEKM